MTYPPVDPNLEPHISDTPPVRDDTRFAAGKIAVFQYATVLIFLFLISGFWRLQVQNPQFYDECAQQNSKIGNANADIKIDLASVGDEQTEINFNGDVKMIGLLASLGQRVMSGVANTLTKQFFANLDKELSKSVTA